MKQHFNQCIALSFLLVFVVPTLAQPAKSNKPTTEPRGSVYDLYGAAAPEDAALVRLVHINPGADPQKFVLGSTYFNPVAYGQVSPYRPVRPEIYQMKIGGMNQELIASMGKYYTIIYTPVQILVFTDPAHTDPVKAQLFLYNFSESPAIDLKTMDGETTVIGGVQQANFGEVRVNALTVELVLYDSEQMLQSVGSLDLQRGQSYSIFVVNEGSDLRVFTQKAIINAD